MSTKSDARKQIDLDAEVERQRAKEASMTDADRAKLAKSHKRRTIFLAIFLAAIAAMVIGAVVAGPDKSVPDAGAQLSCGHFRNVVGDISKGLLTDAEGHAKFQQIYSLARGSAIVAINTDAQTMLAADVSGDPTALATAMVAFSNTCTTAGF